VLIMHLTFAGRFRSQPSFVYSDMQIIHELVKLHHLAHLAHELVALIYGYRYLQLLDFKREELLQIAWLD
jgi:hypothetical protein